MIKPLIAAVMLVGVVAGCSTVQVLKDPGPNSTGIRFYRPKPYLFVTPADATGRLVKLKLEYMPDYNEEYQIKVKGKTKVALKDGWNLVGVNSDGPPPDPAAPAEAAPVAPASGDKLPPVVVAASNVPIGFYESVLEPVNGRKVFRGWRYLGFSVLGGGTPPGDPNLPICGQNPCPHNPGHPCRNPEMPQPVFGLVSVNGVMTFREVGEIAMNNGCPFYVETPTPATGIPAGPAPLIPGNRSTEGVPPNKPTDESQPNRPILSPTPRSDAPPVPAVPIPNPVGVPGPGAALNPDNDSLPPLPGEVKPAAAPAAALAPAPTPVSYARPMADPALRRTSLATVPSTRTEVYKNLYDAGHRGDY